jgi:hypothetical protein
LPAHVGPQQRGVGFGPRTEQVGLLPGLRGQLQKVVAQTLAGYQVLVIGRHEGILRRLLPCLASASCWLPQPTPRQVASSAMAITLNFDVVDFMFLNVCWNCLLNAYRQEGQRIW